MATAALGISGAMPLEMAARPGHAPPSLDGHRPGRRGAVEDRHAGLTVSCGWYALVGLSGSQCGVFPLRCKRWRCRFCGPRKLRAAMARINGGLALGPAQFITLTSPASDDPATSWREFGGRWKRLHQRINRRVGKVEFVLVIETTKRGIVHAHLLYRGPALSEAWLSSAAMASGFGTQVKVGRASGEAARYMVKALLDTSFPPGFRRVRWSAGWFPWTKPLAGTKWRTWRITDAPPLASAISARERGFSVTELVAPAWDPGPRYRPVRWMSSAELRSVPYLPAPVYPFFAVSGLDDLPGAHGAVRARVSAS